MVCVSMVVVVAVNTATDDLQPVMMSVLYREPV
jgi:hypothetical protein